MKNAERKRFIASFCILRFCLLLLPCLLLAGGCAPEQSTAVLPRGVPMIRVRLLQDCREVRVSAPQQVWVKSSSDITPQPVIFRDPGSIIRFSSNQWIVGNRLYGTGELTLTPGQVGGLLLDGKPYRGRYRLVPITPSTFDVINDVDVDGYLKSVLSKELYPSWDEQTYKALAITARTYAIYESRTIGARRYWDVFADQRSQVYGGMSEETSKSVRAVEATSGVVVAYGPAGQEKIFKAYFSSCCGGVSQSAQDAFGDPYSEPLKVQARGATCSISTKYNWGPVVIKKEDLARRLANWARKKSDQEGRPRPELQMQGVSRVELAFVNQEKRPAFFYITDNRNLRFMMRAEDLRLAIATEAARGPTVFSSYFRPVTQADSVAFVDGHGFGHGVGLCQWCAQAQARGGWRHEDIVVSAYPGSRLIRAY